MSLRKKIRHRGKRRNKRVKFKRDTFSISTFPVQSLDKALSDLNEAFDVRHQNPEVLINAINVLLEISKSSASQPNIYLMNADIFGNFVEYCLRNPEEMAAFLGSTSHVLSNVISENSPVVAQFIMKRSILGLSIKVLKNSSIPLEARVHILYVVMNVAGDRNRSVEKAIIDALDQDDLIGAIVSPLRDAVALGKVDIYRSCLRPIISALENINTVMKAASLGKYLDPVFEELREIITQSTFTDIEIISMLIKLLKGIFSVEENVNKLLSIDRSCELVLTNFLIDVFTHGTEHARPDSMFRNKVEQFSRNDVHIAMEVLSDLALIDRELRSLRNESLFSTIRDRLLEALKVEVLDTVTTRHINEMIFFLLNITIEGVYGCKFFMSIDGLVDAVFLIAKKSESLQEDCIGTISNLTYYLPNLDDFTGRYMSDIVWILSLAIKRYDGNYRDLAGREANEAKRLLLYTLESLLNLIFSVSGKCVDEMINQKLDVHLKSIQCDDHKIRRKIELVLSYLIRG